MGIFILSGCAVENESAEEGFDSFILQSISGEVDLFDTEIPTLYNVAPETDKEKVQIMMNLPEDEVTHGTEQLEYDLEEVTVTGEEIVIQYDGKEEVFERLSGTVAENEDGVQYQYFAKEEAEDNGE